MTKESFSAQSPRVSSYEAGLCFIPLFIQCLLLHPRFATSQLARLIRAALLPVVVTLAVTKTAKYTFAPELDSGPLNVQLGVVTMYMVLKSVEFAVQTEPYRRLQLDEPPVKESTPHTPSSSSPSLSSSSLKVGAGSSESGSVIAWALDVFSSARGVGWSWGTPLRCLAPHNQLAGTLKRIIIDHVFFTPAIGFVVLTRDMGGSPTTSLQQIFLWLGIDVRLGPTFSYWLGEYVHTLAFGLCILCYMDLSFNQLAVYWFVGQTILHTLAPNLISKFDWRRWSPLFNDPYRSESIADLWGKRWHMIFRRIFAVTAYDPMVYVTSKAGCSKYVQKFSGILATLSLSGIMHELGIRMISDDSYPWFPWAFMFFFLQVWGILIESLFIHRLTPTLRNVWVWIFVLTTALKWREAWLGTTLAESYPPVAEWWWQRWVLPGCAGLPRGIWHG